METASIAVFFGMPHPGKSMPAGAGFGGTGILPVIRSMTGKMPVLQSEAIGRIRYPIKIHDGICAVAYARTILMWRFPRPHVIIRPGGVENSIMRSTYLASIAVGLVVMLQGAFPADLPAQEFPYIVPMAPEFNSSGELVRPDRSATGRSRRRYRAPSAPPVAPSSGNYRRPRPYAPPPSEELVYPQPMNPPAPQYAQPPQRPRAVAPVPQRPPAVASAPPTGAVPSSVQQQGPPRTPDCSGYPMLIANARSDAEMQTAAREYLTCLMMNGWPQEQAKKHVIGVIETAYNKYAR